ncbi:metallochaperone AztD [Pelagibacterium lacus]|uniref:Zinc transport system substrate-binding protein n=1 Tax=Pelagibacterium lacus TaxID=2282655 RepID=A0A369W8W8_9HYPH|nr:metallochaperone AztD [Pelagibacterium lacus]RDE10419.1 hypothetical protein DVH29_00245 [Pelagibacterium lacus]
MKSMLLGTSALTLIASLAGGALADEEVTAWRLFVSDHGQPIVTVIDAVEGAVIDSFAIGSPASLYRSDSGETVFAVQGAAGAVAAISTGIAFDDHGDHADIDVDAPALTGFVAEGQSPSHFVEHSGRFAAFFDGEGVARVFSETDALAGAGDLREFAADAPHHGVVISYANHDIVSIPNPEDPSSAPVGVRILDRDGNAVGDDIACAGLHGEATSGNLVAIGGCADGILVVHSTGGVPSVEPLTFTEGLGEGRVSTLIGGRGLQYFLGNFDADTVAIIDPAEDDAFRLVDLPTRRVHFVVDNVRARFAYVLTEDGHLHQLDVLSGEIAQSVQVTGPYSVGGSFADPRPRVAVAGDTIVVTDPLEGKLHLVDAARFEVTGEIAVEGMPFNIVAVGGTGVVHGDHDHDHDDHEGHDHD